MTTGGNSGRPRSSTTTTTYHAAAHQEQRTRSSSLEDLWQWSATGERFPRPAKFKVSVGPKPDFNLIITLIPNLISGYQVQADISIIRYLPNISRGSA